MRIISLSEIRTALRVGEAAQLIEAGFRAYSAGEAMVPPVGHLGFVNPPGDCHIKYGRLNGDKIFVIKISTGFYANAAKGLSSSNGMMLIFSAETGVPLALLDDGGYLTDIRTAIAGMIVAQWLAPSTVRAIGIIGTGIQARLQAELLHQLHPQAPILIWGRDPERVKLLKQQMAVDDEAIQIVDDPADLCAAANLIVTATAAPAPIVMAAWIQPGTHITAVGADGPGKQELEIDLVAAADVLIADSIAQCSDHGEISHALRAQRIRYQDITELGALLDGQIPGRTREDQITLADLTGVAVQDIQIAKHIWQACQPTTT